jgi:predicted hydrolase (HD superfamily)
VVKEVEMTREEALDSIKINVENENPIKHMLATEAVMRALARELGASEAMAHAILCHNEIHGIPRETKLDKALFCADPLADLVIITALVRPDRKLAGLQTKSVKGKFKEKSFAAEVSREQISSCSEIGLELDEFIELGLKAMRGIAADLGL